MQDGEDEEVEKPAQKRQQFIDSLSPRASSASWGGLSLTLFIVYIFCLTGSSERQMELALSHSLDGHCFIGSWNWEELGSLKTVTAQEAFKCVRWESGYALNLGFVQETHPKWVMVAATKPYLILSLEPPTMAVA